MCATNTRTERLDCRIAPSQKRMLERAAEKLGLRLTDFVVSTLAMAAQEVLREDEPMRLSRADWDSFVSSLDEDRSSRAGHFSSHSSRCQGRPGRPQPASAPGRLRGRTSPALPGKSSP